jgi:hypothetical protein
VRDVREVGPNSALEHATRSIHVALASVLLFGCTPEIGASVHTPDQIENRTGLPQKDIREVKVSTVDHFKLLIGIEYFYDRIGKPELTALAPQICARQGMTLDKSGFLDDRSVPADSRAVRARFFEVRCR